MSTKKKATAEKPEQAKVPKWGTPEWIMAYPWSKMDKDRRRRVRKVLKDEDQSLFTPMGGSAKYIGDYIKMLASIKVSVPHRTIDEVKVAADRVDGFITGANDALIAMALCRHWCDKKPCAGCCSDKKPCKQTYKKSAKTKK